MISGKVWGSTELIEANGALEFHRIATRKGGVCSKHLHEFKWNGFYVESGTLLIRVWQNDYERLCYMQVTGQRLNPVLCISSNVLKTVLPLKSIGLSLIIMILSEKL
jgi:hypothetical protein